MLGFCVKTWGRIFNFGVVFSFDWIDWCWELLVITLRPKTGGETQKFMLRHLLDKELWNENILNTLSRINWRASLVPAAAVIPAPIAYIKVVAVKKLVVGLVVVAGGLALSASALPAMPSLGGTCVALGCRAGDAHRLL